MFAHDSAECRVGFEALSLVKFQTHHVSRCCHDLYSLVAMRSSPLFRRLRVSASRSTMRVGA